MNKWIICLTGCEHTYREMECIECQPKSQSLTKPSLMDQLTLSFDNKNQFLISIQKNLFGLAHHRCGANHGSISVS